MKGTAPTSCQFSIQANSPLQRGTATWILTCFYAPLQLKWAPSSGQFKPQGALKVCYSLLPSSGFVCVCILKGKSTDFTYQAYESSGIVSSVTGGTLQSWEKKTKQMMACCHQVYVTDVTDYVEFKRCSHSPAMDGLVLWEIWEM